MHAALDFYEYQKFMNLQKEAKLEEIRNQEILKLKELQKIGMIKEKL